MINENTPLHPQIFIRKSEESPKKVWRKLKDSFGWNRWELMGEMTSTRIAHETAYNFFIRTMGYLVAVTDIDPNHTKIGG